MNFLNLARLIVALGFIALAGCSTLTEFRSDMADKIFGREPPNPPAVLQEIKPTYTAKIDWSSNAGKTEKYDYTPAIDSSAVYATNTAGEILKLDANNGRQIWRVNVGESISGGVGIGSGILLLPTNKIPEPIPMPPLIDSPTLMRQI